MVMVGIYSLYERRKQIIIHTSLFPNHELIRTIVTVILHKYNIVIYNPEIHNQADIIFVAAKPRYKTECIENELNIKFKGIVFFAKGFPVETNNRSFLVTYDLNKITNKIELNNTQMDHLKNWLMKIVK